MTRTYRDDPEYKAELRRHIDTGSAWVHVEAAAVRAERRLVLDTLRQQVNGLPWTPGCRRGGEQVSRADVLALVGVPKEPADTGAGDSEAMGEMLTFARQLQHVGFVVERERDAYANPASRGETVSRRDEFYDVEMSVQEMRDLYALLVKEGAGWDDLCAELSNASGEDFGAVGVPKEPADE